MPGLCEPAVMKTIFDSKEIAHAWAHELAPRGTCAQAKSFHGASFYSYNTEIGRIIRRNGKRAYVLNEQSYSVTTSKHQNNMAAAIPNAPVFRFCGDLDKANGPALFNYAMDKAATAAAKVATARNKDAYLSDQAQCIERAEEVNQFFNLKRKVDKITLAKLTKRITDERAKREKAQTQRQAKIDADNQVKVDKWLSGEINAYFPSVVSRTYLRVWMAPETDVESVQTSRGVTIPIPEAERAFRFAIARRTKGWKRNGDQFHVGQYQLDAINSNGIVAGCHRFDWQEIERFGKLQGWI